MALQNGKFKDGDEDGECSGDEERDGNSDGMGSDILVNLLEELSLVAALRDDSRVIPAMSWKCRWVFRLSKGMQRVLASNGYNA